MNGIKCGHCKERHSSVRDVKACSRYGTPLSVTDAPVRERLAEKAAFAAREREQEEAGFASDPDFQRFVKSARVPDGFYTAVLDEETDDRITIRLRTQPANARFAPGEQVAAYLSGPENESDYTGFAFVKDDGKFNVWKRFRANVNSEGSRLALGLNLVLGNVEETGQRYALESGRCRRCNRTLTVPASINRGFGPHCAGEVGL